MVGESMKAMWNKLRRLQPVMRKLNKHVFGIHGQIAQTRKDLHDAQNIFNKDKLNPQSDHNGVPAKTVQQASMGS